MPLDDDSDDELDISMDSGIPPPPPPPPLPPPPSFQEVSDLFESLGGDKSSDGEGVREDNRDRDNNYNYCSESDGGDSEFERLAAAEFGDSPPPPPPPPLSPVVAPPPPPSLPPSIGINDSDDDNYVNYDDKNDNDNNNDTSTNVETMIRGRGASSFDAPQFNRNMSDDDDDDDDEDDDEEKGEPPASMLRPPTHVDDPPPPPPPPHLSLHGDEDTSTTNSTNSSFRSSRDDDEEEDESSSRGNMSEESREATVDYPPPPPSPHSMNQPSDASDSENDQNSSPTSLVTAAPLEFSFSSPSASPKPYQHNDELQVNTTPSLPPSPPPAVHEEITFPPPPPSRLPSPRTSRNSSFSSVSSSSSAPLLPLPLPPRSVNSFEIELVNDDDNIVDSASDVEEEAPQSLMRQAYSINQSETASSPSASSVNSADSHESTSENEPATTTEYYTRIDKQSIRSKIVTSVTDSNESPQLAPPPLPPSSVDTFSHFSTNHQTVESTSVENGLSSAIDRFVGAGLATSSRRRSSVSNRSTTSNTSSSSNSNNNNNNSNNNDSNSGSGSGNNNSSTNNRKSSSNSSDAQAHEENIAKQEDDTISTSQTNNTPVYAAPSAAEDDKDSVEKRRASFSALRSRFQAPTRPTAPSFSSFQEFQRRQSKTRSATIQSFKNEPTALSRRGSSPHTSPSISPKSVVVTNVNTKKEKEKEHEDEDEEVKANKRESIYNTSNHAIIDQHSSKEKKRTSHSSFQTHKHEQTAAPLKPKELWSADMSTTLPSFSKQASQASSPEIMPPSSGSLSRTKISPSPPAITHIIEPPSVVPNRANILASEIQVLRSELSALESIRDERTAELKTLTISNQQHLRQLTDDVHTDTQEARTRWSASQRKLASIEDVGDRGCDLLLKNAQLKKKRAMERLDISQHTLMDLQRQLTDLKTIHQQVEQLTQTIGERSYVKLMCHQMKVIGDNKQQEERHTIAGLAAVCMQTQSILNEIPLAIQHKASIRAAVSKIKTASTTTSTQSGQKNTITDVDVAESKLDGSLAGAGNEKANDVNDIDAIHFLPLRDVQDMHVARYRAANCEIDHLIHDITNLEKVRQEQNMSNDLSNTERAGNMLRKSTRLESYERLILEEKLLETTMKQMRMTANEQANVHADTLVTLKRQQQQKVVTAYDAMRTVYTDGFRHALDECDDSIEAAAQQASSLTTQIQMSERKSFTLKDEQQKFVDKVKTLDDTQLHEILHAEQQLQRVRAQLDKNKNMLDNEVGVGMRMSLQAVRDILSLIPFSPGAVDVHERFVRKVSDAGQVSDAAHSLRELEAKIALARSFIKEPARIVRHQPQRLRELAKAKLISYQALDFGHGRQPLRISLEAAVNQVNGKLRQLARSRQRAREELESRRSEWRNTHGNDQELSKWVDGQ